MNCLLELLATMDWDTAQSNIHTAALGCVKALMNNSVSIIIRKTSNTLYKKVSDFPFPSRDVTNKLPLAGNNLIFSRPGSVR